MGDTFKKVALTVGDVGADEASLVVAGAGQRRRGPPCAALAALLLRVERRARGDGPRLLHPDRVAVDPARLHRSPRERPLAGLGHRRRVEPRAGDERRAPRGRRARYGRRPGRHDRERGARPQRRNHQCPPAPWRGRRRARLERRGTGPARRAGLPPDVLGRHLLDGCRRHRRRGPGRDRRACVDDQGLPRPQHRRTRHPRRSHRRRLDRQA